MQQHTARLRVALALVLALVAAACGSDGGDGAADQAAGTEGAASLSTEAAGGGGGEEGAADTEDLLAQGTLGGYQDLPFTEVLPLEEGPVEIDGETPDITIGFSQTGFNHPWRIAMLESLQAEVDRHPNVDLVVLDGNVDIVKQTNDIDDLLARGVDAIVMSPVESDGLVPAADRVMEAGIPLVVLDRDVFTEKSLFIGQSNVTMAQGVAEEMIEALGGEGKIVEITGLVGSSPAIDRSEGLQAALEDAPGIEVLATGDGEWIREPAVTLMEDWLVTYPEINAVFSHAEESSWGAQLAIARAGRCDDDIMHVTHDGSSPGFESVAGGQFEADGNYSPFIGDIGVRAALLLLQGEEIQGAEAYDQPGQYLQLEDLPVVTPENVEEWVPRGWGDFETPVDPCA